MAIVVEERPRRTNAERYVSWNQSSQAVLAFVGDEQQVIGQPVFVRGNDPSDTSVTAMLLSVHEGWYVPVRDGDWIVDAGNASHMVLRPAEFDARWRTPAIL